MSHPVVPCPTCGAEVVFSPDNPHRPFCSERCRWLDLGAWADGRHAIPGEPAELPETEDGTASDDDPSSGGPL